MNLFEFEGESNKFHYEGARQRLTESDTRQFVHRYLPWLQRELKIDQLPEIELLDDPITTSFGQYNSEDKTIKLVIGGRHPVDVLRTIAHELTHYKQDLAGDLEPGAGEAGTPQENEANSNAGIVMRNFAKANPEYFGIKEDISRRGFLRGAGAAVATVATGGALAKNKPEVVSIMTKKGDTIYSLAREYHTTPEVIVDLNRYQKLTLHTKLPADHPVQVPYTYPEKKTTAPDLPKPVVPGTGIYTDPNDKGITRSAKSVPASHQVAEPVSAPGSRNALKEPGFRDKLEQVATKLGVSSRALLGLMSHETFRTFNPAMQAPPQRSRSHPDRVIPGAVGLIQFTHSTANDLGTSTEELKRMSGTQQLDYVYKFLKDKARPGMDEGDLYMSIFLPAMVGKSPNTVVGKKDSRKPIVPGGVTLHDIWDGNPTFGKSRGKNYFTIQDVKDEVSKFLRW